MFFVSTWWSKESWPACSPVNGGVGSSLGTGGTVHYFKSLSLMINLGAHFSVVRWRGYLVLALKGIGTQRGAIPKKPSPRSLCFIEGKLLLSSSSLRREPPKGVRFAQRLRVPAQVSLRGSNPNSDGRRDKDFTLSVPHFLCLEKRSYSKCLPYFTEG